MKCSPRGRAFISGWEADKLTSYKDGGGVWTIGRGHTGPDVKPNMAISQFESDELFEMDLEDHDITPYLDGAPTSQNQFDAMTALAFNIGLERFRGSTVLKRHKQGNYERAGSAFGLWVYDGGKRVQGLINRREAERQLYMRKDGL